VKARLAASIVLTAALALGTTGCTLIAVQGTLKQYQPSDGVAATVGDLKVRNLFGVTSDGTDLALVFTVINTGTSAQTLQVQYTDTDKTPQTILVPVEAGASLSVGGPNAQLVLRNAGATLGALYPVYLVYGTAQGTQAQVPVLDNRMESYIDLLPSPAPTVEPTAVPSPTAIP
jgi:hypothetical protein